MLRLDESMSSCGLLSSHDDYSVADLLPERSAVLTQLRYQSASHQQLDMSERPTILGKHLAKGVCLRHWTSSIAEILPANVSRLQNILMQIRESPPHAEQQKYIWKYLGQEGIETYIQGLA